MAGLNKVLLIGNVGGDPEIKTLPSGAKVANFSLATSESYTDRSGQKQTQTEWHRIEIWEGLANVVEQYVKKGDPIYIEGKIKTERWTDQNGQERSGVRIRALSMQMLGGRPSSSPGQIDQTASYGNPVPPATAPVPNESKPETETQVNNGADEDDLPF